MNETMRARAAARLAVYDTDRHVVTDGTAARINARLIADGLTRHIATLGKNGKLYTETFWAYAETSDDMAASVAYNRGATLISVKPA